jgi:hypothetical protein
MREKERLARADPDVDPAQEFSSEGERAEHRARAGEFQGLQ